MSISREKALLKMLLKIIDSRFLKIYLKSTYAKVHSSVSLDALQRKEKEKSAFGKVHDPAFKITEINFREILLCNFLVKNKWKLLIL